MGISFFQKIAAVTVISEKNFLSRIAVIAETLPKDRYKSGVGVVVGETVSAAMEHHLHVTLIGPSATDQTCDKRITVPCIRPVRNYPSTFPFLIFWTFALYNALQEVQLVHIHSVTPLSVWSIVILSMMKNRPKVVFHLHTDFSQYLAAWIGWKLLRDIAINLTASVTRFCCNRADKILAPSAFFAKKMKRELKLDRNIEVWSSPITLPEIEAEVKVPQGPYIVCACRVGDEKNIVHLFKVLTFLSKEISLVIVGGGEIKRYKKIIAEKWPKLEKRIIFTGAVSRVELLAYCRKALCFVFGSKTETQGLTVFEALAMRIPAFVMKGYCFDDLLSDCEDVSLLPDDPEAWAAAISMFMYDRSLAKIAGNEGAKLVEEKLSSRVQRKRLVTIYRLLHSE
ncbi:MAG: glycosyltransferase [Patescibacteria group bacterium]|jgi:glycosyltransferase involved in cell wall biosynthesis